MRSASRASRVLVATGLALCGLIAAASHASAHTELLDSSPQDGSAVATSPSRVEMHFTRQVSPVLVLVSVSDAEGHDVPVLSKAVNPADSTILFVGVPHLSDDTYRLRYNLLDAVDLHRTVGSIVFGVGGRAVLAPEGSTSIGPGVFDSVVQYGTVAGLSVVLGAALLLLLVVPRARANLPDPAGVHRRVLWIALGATGVMAVAAVATLLSKASSLPQQTGLGDLLTGTDFGRWWIASTAATVLLAVALSIGQWVPSWRQSRAVPAVAAALAVWVAIAVAAVGHNGDATGDSFWGTATRGFHLVAVGVWAGGLAILAAVLLGLRGQPRAAARRAVLESFSVVAAVSFLAAVASGLVLAGVQVQTVTALLSTVYGTELMIKVGIVVAVAALALWHTRAIWRRNPGRAPSPGGGVRLRTLAVECAGAAAIIAIAVVLGGTAPARGPIYDAPAAPSADAVSVTPADLLVHLSLRPNLPGTNVLDIRAVSSRRPAPGPVQSIIVRFGGPAVAPATVDLGAVDPSGTASRSVTLESPGSMTMDVTVVRGGVPQLTTHIDWSVGAPQAPRHPTVVSTMAVAPFAFAGAAVVLCAGAGVAVLLWARRRRMRPPAPAALDGVAG